MASKFLDRVICLDGLIAKQEHALLYRHTVYIILFLLLLLLLLKERRREERVCTLHKKEAERECVFVFEGGRTENGIGWGEAEMMTL